MLEITAPLMTMGGLGAFFAAALAVADRKLRVEEDPRIGLVAEALPGANCGACGFAGCNAYAEAVVTGNAPLTGCPVGGQAVVDAIASILGVEAGTATRKVARLMCRGGRGVARTKARYLGPPDCSLQDIVSGGATACRWGCLGGGDCVAACGFGALEMGSDGLPVVHEELCTGCGACVSACPRDLFELHPVDRRFFVFCRNRDDPRTARAVCEAACTGCGLCARKSNGAITMVDGLPLINYDLLDPDAIPVEKCKTGAIGWVDPKPGAGMDTSAPVPDNEGVRA